MKPKLKGKTTMRAWKRMKAKTNSTPGISKGSACQANAIQRHCMKSGRGYKHPEYGTICKKYDRMN